jgi:hypothetical protein
MITVTNGTLMLMFMVGLVAGIMLTWLFIFFTDDGEEIDVSRRH